MPKFRWRYKCTRCKRHIKWGCEFWIHNEPYGEYCYKLTINLEAHLSLVLSDS
jgi:hypothetical protein